MPEIRLVIGERQGCQGESTDLWLLLLGGVVKDVLNLVCGDGCPTTRDT